MNQGWRRLCSHWYGQAVTMSLFVAVEAIVLSGSAVAQLVPDDSLGTEASIVQPDVLVRGAIGDRIQGGALRGSALFHSFSQFNVGEQQRVYFANPVSIETILTRVTGGNPSRILGTLGVDGSASLFLINPNGILFGSNARLDIAGSFVASTADRLVWEDGTQFSASQPAAPPLLNIRVQPGLQYGAQPGAIVSRGNLAAGQDLTLAGGNVTLQGTLRAGQNLTLRATDTLTIRDEAAQPFIASANGMVQVQGDRAVDIFTLNHPASGFFAGNDLVLRSAGPVGGDAHYFAGGSFRVEQLDGSIGSWFSPFDPVIRASGNVSFVNYTGASLHILAGGAVTAGSITINAPDAVNSIQETVRLSNGQTIAINGRAQQTLDIRAGTSAVGIPGTIGAPLPTGLTTGSVPTNANISIGSIINRQPTALVFLTNQYQPIAGAGNIPGGITVGSINTSNAAGGGSVAIDSRGSLTLTGAVNVAANTGSGGNVTMLSQGNLTLAPGASILSRGTLGGTITLNSGDTVTINGTGNPALFTVTSDSRTLATGGRGGDVTIAGRAIGLNNAGNVLASTRGGATGGNLSLRADTIALNSSEADTAVFPGATGGGGTLTVAARSLTLQNTAGLLAVTLGSGNAGAINIAADTIALTDVGARANPSQMGSLVFPGANGNAGNLNLTTRSLSVTNGAQIVATTFGNGNAGAIAINATESATFAGVNGSFFSGAISTVERGATGRGGSIRLTTDRLSITDGAQIRTTTRGADAGSIDINANTLLVSGVGSNQRPSAIASAVLAGGTGNGGDITLRARTASFADGATVSANTASAIGGTQGNAGNIQITALDSITFDGIGAGGFHTIARVDALGAGRGGTLSLETPRLALTNGAQLLSTTSGSGNAGTIFVQSNDTILIAGADSGLFANTEPGSSGNGGRIVIDPATVVLRDRARISVDSQGTGVGGSIQIQANSLTLSNQSTISAETNSSAGGDIDLQIRDLVLLRQGSRISTTAGKAQGQGDGGNIRIRTNFVVAVKTENSDITANAFLGRGGRVDITTQGIFGIAYRDRLTPFSDITVSSEFGLAGIVTVNGIIIDPERGLISLPANLVDAASLVAQSCSAQGGTVARQQGEFVVTGRGGVPASPNDVLNSQSVWQDLRTLSPSTAQNSNIQPSSTQPSSTQTMISSPTPIVEAQRWLIDPTGQISLVAHTSTGSFEGWKQRSLPCPAQNHQQADSR